MAGGFSVTITAVDGATAAINKVNKALSALMAPVTRLQSSLAKFGDVSGMTKVANGLGAIASAALRVARNLALIVTPLSAITSAVSIAGMARMADNWARFAQRLGFDATRIGVAAERLHSLQGAAQLAGASSDALTSGMRNLSDALTDSVGGRNPEAVVMFRTLGIEFSNLDGTARKAVDVLPEVADGIARIRNPTLQAHAATMLFGGAAEDLLPFLRRGAAGIREYYEAAHRYGAISAEGVRVAGAMREAQVRLGLAWEGVSNAVSEKVAPVLTRLFNFMSEWVLQHKEPITKFVTGIATAFENWAKDGGLTRLFDAIQRIATALSSLTMPKWLQRWLGVAGADDEEQFGGLSGATLGAGSEFSPPPSGYRLENRVTGGHDLWPTRYSVDPSAPSMGGEDRDAAAREIFDQLLGLGWSPASAAGAVANFDAESGFNHRLPGDGGKAYGIGQWHPARQAQFTRWSGGKRIQDASRADQVRFFDWEARGGDYRFAAANITNRSDPGLAGEGISLYGERPKDAEGEARRRAAAAQQWYGRLTGSGGAAAPGIYRPAAPGASAAPVSGSVKVDVTLKGAPPGTTMRTETDGPVRATGRIETSMPAAGSAP